MGCGPAALCIVLATLGVELDEAGIWRLMPDVDEDYGQPGTSCDDVKLVAERLGLAAEIFRCDWPRIGPGPAKRPRAGPVVSRSWDEMRLNVPFMALVDWAVWHQAHDAPPHWVVVVGEADGGVEVHDPDPRGGPSRWRHLSLFFQAWHGIDGATGRLGVRLWKPETE